MIRMRPPRIRLEIVDPKTGDVICSATSRHGCMITCEAIIVGGDPMQVVEIRATHRDDDERGA